jgi:hypothetical protein
LRRNALREDREDLEVGVQQGEDAEVQDCGYSVCTWHRGGIDGEEDLLGCFC